MSVDKSSNLLHILQIRQVQFIDITSVLQSNIIEALLKEVVGVFSLLRDLP